jgi:hypothetical protein
VRPCAPRRLAKAATRLFWIFCENRIFLPNSFGAPARDGLVPERPSLLLIAGPAGPGDEAGEACPGQC